MDQNPCFLIDKDTGTPAVIQEQTLTIPNRKLGKPR